MISSLSASEPSVVINALITVGCSPRHLDIVQHESSPLPYHNWRHAVRTAIRARQSATLYGLDTRPVMVAALYHDTRHLGPRAGGDGENIARAVECWLQLGRPAEYALAEVMHRETPAWLADVPRLIAATRFPHTPTAAFDELVLRNADMAETIDPEWCRLLEAETGRPAVAGFAEQHMVDLAVLHRAAKAVS